LTSATNVCADRDEVYILPPEFYSEQYTFFGHSPGGTWHEDDVAVVLWFVAHPLVAILIASSVVGGCIAFAYKRWKRKRRAGYLPIRNVDAIESDGQNGEKHAPRSVGFAFLHERLQQLRNWLAGEVNFGTSYLFQPRRASSSIDSSEEHTVKP
jgi:hypothetical protein